MADGIDLIRRLKG